MYGVTEGGSSVAAFVHGFEPYFYVEAPSPSFSPDDCQALAAELNVGGQSGDWWHMAGLEAGPAGIRVGKGPKKAGLVPAPTNCFWWAEGARSRPRHSARLLMRQSCPPPPPPAGAPVGQGPHQECAAVPAGGAGAQADHDALPAAEGPPLPPHCAGGPQPGGPLQE